MKHQAMITLRALMSTAALAALAVPPAASAERAAFLAGQYATKEDCQKLRTIEAGGPRTVETAPELLDASGFHGWEGGCEFTKVFEHSADKQWFVLAICFEGPAVNPHSYVFTKDEQDGGFDVVSGSEGEPTHYARCDAKKGK